MSLPGAGADRRDDPPAHLSAPNPLARGALDRTARAWPCGTLPSGRGHTDLCRVKSSPIQPPFDDASRDVLIIGSGFGGALAAHALVHAGWRVTLVERGPWVKRGEENWLPESVGGLGPYFSTGTGWRDVSRSRPKSVGTYHCVGGPSVFYGGVSLGFREANFEPVA